MADRKKTKEELAAETVQILNDPEVATIVAKSLSENCAAVKDVFYSSLIPFKDPKPESIQAIMNAIDNKIPTLPKDDQDKFAKLNAEIAAAGLSKEIVIEEALGTYIFNAPDKVAKEGKACVMP